MSISIVWDNEEKTIVRYIYEGKWTWDELYDAIEEANTMLDEVDHQVGAIIDLRRSSLLPQNALRQGKRLTMIRPPKEEMTVVVGANALIQRLSNTFFKIYRRQATRRAFHFTSTIEEAYAILAK